MGSGVIARRHLTARRLILRAFVLALLIAGPSAAMASAEDGPLVQELLAEGGEPRQAVSGRFHVQAAGDAARLAGLLASFETAYRAFWQGRAFRPGGTGGPARDTVVPAGGPVNVVVFARLESLRRFAARLGIARPAFDAGGIFLRESRTIAVGSESRLGRVVEAALVHEAAHLLNLEILGPALSPWLNEGLAGFCQYSAVTADGKPLLGQLDEGSEVSLAQEDGSEILYQFVPKRSLSYLMGQFFRDHGLSLGPMLDAGPAEAFQADNAQLHYAASWTLVHMLAQGRSRRAGALRPRLDRYAELERQGLGGRAALLGVMEMSMEELDEAWRRHVKRLW